MIDFNKMIGERGPNHTGPVQVAARHCNVDKATWPAIIILGEAVNCANGEKVMARLEMTPEEAVTLAHQLIQMINAVR